MGCCGDDDNDATPPSAADLLEPLNSPHAQTQNSTAIMTISPMNSNFSALLCKDTLHAILEKLPLVDIGRAACVCRLWRLVASDRELLIGAFVSPWKLRDVIGNPSSGSFWRDNSLTKFAVSHRLSRGDSVASLAVKYAVQYSSTLVLFGTTGGDMDTLNRSSGWSPFPYELKSATWTTVKALPGLTPAIPSNQKK
ncbi:hypothetical protein RD792_015858 [Penstemon davidsonii]|uniref:F-box domain-containing protein n=1 Tax=Penstemon davidsonii TaxID=160366 RepID=A0ABR0CJH4_9LAMI|nr:hypothetical protein RD792_015858 [Penstemon davidsonii]